MRYGIYAALLSLVVATSCPVAAEPTTDSARLAVWDLSVIYPDAAAAERERNAIDADSASLSRYKDHLGDSAAMLQAGLDARSGLIRRARRLYKYAFLTVAEDARVPSSQALQASAGITLAKVRAASAFFDSEIIGIGAAKLAKFEAADPGLARYDRTLELATRQIGHVLSPETEAAIAASSPLQRAPSTIHSVFSNGELPWPTINVHGAPTKIDQATYRTLLRDPDRSVRRMAFEAYTTALGQFGNTQAALLRAHVSAAAYEAKLRHYPGSAEFLLAEDAMPADAFAAMSHAAVAEQPAIDRYLVLRAQALGIDKVHSYDLNVPLSETAVRYPLSDGEALVLKALAPLGADYLARLSTGFQAKRMNALPAPGKDPGAMTMAFNDDVPPMVMITYTGDAESVFTLAHEWGHAMHMQMAAQAQPYENADASVFLGDTPSLLNEMLVNDYMVSHAASRAEKIAALSEAIETLRRTYYQVLPMMRVEMAERAAADKGDPLTADTISKMSCDELRSFDGAERGISVVDPGACALWTVSQEPYDNLYFYKYLNAVSAAAFFADAIERHEPGALDRYFTLLRAGGSDDPYVLLKRAGFDARDPAAYAAMGKRFERDVDELEAELRAQGADRPVKPG